MSKPENVLARYRSYAYHQILIVCESTETALLLSNESDITSFGRKPGQNKYASVPFNGGGYVVLANGLTDSDFYIESSQWDTVISPNKADQNAMMQLDGDLQIVEPYGARFMNVITNVCDELETDPSGLVFLLKTVFVGHNDDDHRFNTEVMPNFRPLLFTMIDLTAQFDEAGARYNLAFVGAANGFGKLPHVSKVAKGFSMNINTSVSLAYTLDELATKLNDTYDNFAEQLGINFGKDNVLGDYRKVEYAITAPDYDTELYKAGTNENARLFSDTIKTTLQPGNDLNVEQLIDRIMRSSREVMAEATADEEEKHLYKINSFLRSSPERVIVEYQVNRYRVEASPFEDTSGKRTNVNQDKKENILEFDYIFSGKNTDIIDMDMKMEMGLAFFHTAATTNNVPDQVEGLTNVKSEIVAGSGGSQGKASRTFKHRKRTPLFLGDQVSSPLERNSTAPVSTATFQALMSRHAALENLGIVIKIHGNPQLMGEMLKTHVIDNEPRTSFMSAPALVKINIKMPAHGQTTRDFSEPFWYDGFYMLHSVKNIFDQGMFTQELTMFSVMVTDDTTDKFDSVRDEFTAVDKKAVASTEGPIDQKAAITPSTPEGG